MNSQHSPHEVAKRNRARRAARRGQSIVEYGLTLVLMFMLAQGTGRAVYQTVVTTVSNVRSTLNVNDDPTPTAGPSPTVLLPPQPPTLTALPPTITVLAMCTVPDLRDLQYHAAVDEWQNYGFSAGTLTKPANKSNTFVIGTQSLTIGRSLPCRTTTMQVGPKQCTVPNLEGQIFTSARDGAWFANGFIKDNLLRPADSTDSFPIGSQQYDANTNIDCDLTMQVEPQLCVVPDLTGKAFNISGSGSAHATWNQTFTPANLTRKAGMPDSFTVANQSLNANDVVYCSTRMEVWPALCQVPNLVGSSYLGAQTLWTNRGFEQALQKAANTPADFTISNQSLTASTADVSTWLPCASTTMTVQPNMCTVPSMVGQQYSVAAAQWTQPPNNFVSTLRAPSTVTGNFTITSQQVPAGTVTACTNEVFVQPNMCTVPNMNNKTFGQATTAWNGAGFTGVLNNPLNLSGSTQIKQQQHTAGESRACADSMWVKPNVCVVPDLNGDMYDDVTGTGEPFKVACPSATLSRGWGGSSNRRIGTTSPAAGTEVASNATVTANEMLCTVPNMNGQLHSVATAAGGPWANALFTSSLAKAWGTSNPTDRVIGTTNPAAGSSLICSGTVTANEKACTVPSLIGMTFSAAGTTWAQNGFSSSLTRGAQAPASGDFVIASQTTSAGTVLSCSAAQTVQPAVCTVPNMVNQQVGAAQTLWATAGFTAGNLTLNPTTALSGWNVTAQSLTSGSTVACATGASTLTAQSTLVVSISAPSNNSSGDNDVASQAPKLKANAYDSAVTGGNRGIDRVVFTITPESGGAAQSVTVSSSTTYYCAYGPNNPSSGTTCTGGFSPAWSGTLTPGYYQITATAYSTDANKGSKTSTSIRFEVRQ